MTTIYTSVSLSGYNASPPADDGSLISTNKITWNKHKEKLGDPLKNLSENINTNLVTAFSRIFHSATTNITTTTTLSDADRGKTITTENTITVNLEDPATAGNNYFVTVINSDGGTVTIDAGSDTINGANTLLLTAQYSGAFLFSDGTEYFALEFGPISNARLADVSTATIKGRTTAGTGSPEDLTPLQARDIIDVYSKSESDGLGFDPQSPAYDSGNQTYTAAGLLTLTHSLGYTPLLWRVYAVCVTAEDGFSIGDIIELGTWNYTQASTANYNWSTKVGATQFKVVMGSGGLLAQNESATTVALTAANFKIRVIAW